MSFKCKIGLHTWEGCKCSECEKNRDEQHDWSKDCEKCTKCGKTRDKQHDWSNDCERCSKCYKISKYADLGFSRDCSKCSKINFFTSCKNGNLKKVEYCITSPINLTSIDLEGNTPLFIASKNGQIEIVRLLLEKGAKVNVKNKEGKSILDEVLFRSSNPQKEIVKQLLLYLDKDSFIDIKKRETAAIYNAARSGHKEILEILLEYGFDGINSQDREGWSPLQLASAANDLPIVQLLIDNGATIDIKDNDCTTPLYIASGRGHKNIVKLLLDKGANINIQNYYSVFPLYQASREGHLEVVKLLLERGANINLQDEGGWTALHVASKRNRPDIVKLLLEKGANPYLKTSEGNTAHYYAANDSISRLFK